MFRVVDVNVVLSALWKKGDSFNVFALNDLLDRFEFIAPEFFLIELEKHKEEIFKRSKLSKDIFDEVLEMILDQITIIFEPEFSRFLLKAKELLSVHLKDVQYVALALKLECSIFLGDKILREILSNSPIKVLSPKEMLAEL